MGLDFVFLQVILNKPRKHIMTDIKSDSTVPICKLVMATANHIKVSSTRNRRYSTYVLSELYQYYKIITKTVKCLKICPVEVVKLWFETCDESL